MKVWVPVSEFEGYYEVNRLGEVKNSRGRIMAVKASGRGYPSVDLRKPGIKKRKVVHRILAQAFIPNPNNLEMVNHRDNNKKNYNLSNLEWVTRGQNIAHGYLIKGRCNKGWRLSTLEYLQKEYQFSTVEEMLLFLKENRIQKLKSQNQ